VDGLRPLSRLKNLKATFAAVGLGLAVVLALAWIVRDAGSDAVAPIDNGPATPAASTTKATPVVTEGAGGTPATSFEDHATEPTELQSPLDVDEERLAPTPAPRAEGLSVQLPQLSNDAWLVGGQPDPLRVVRTDEVGNITEELWAEDPRLAGSDRDGHTLWCSDIDGDGEVDLVDVYYAFEDPLRQLYSETLIYDGETISESSRLISGASLPVGLYEFCGEPSGHTVRVTKMQLTAVLELAGFTNVVGDRAIDPTWSAAATWNGAEYFPINLYQGQFRPDPSAATELLSCGVGALVLPLDLPAEARAQLVEIADCAA